MLLAGFVVVLFLVVLGGLFIWRWSDLRAEAQQWRLLAPRQKPAKTFDLQLIAGLPEAAQRYFAFSIAPGTPLCDAVEIIMQGSIGLGTKEKPGIQPMQARQILAPRGFIWSVKAGRGILRFSGSDGLVAGVSWTRFWLSSILPVVRAQGPDHYRSAFGRLVGEAVVWAPSALLPRPGVVWSAVDPGTARVSVTQGELTQSVDVCIAADGRPTKVVFARWNDANPEHRFRLQPFGGYLSEHKAFGGYRLATRLDGGNFIDTPDYFPSYHAEVTDIRFPQEEHA